MFVLCKNTIYEIILEIYCKYAIIDAMEDWTHMERKYHVLSLGT